MCLLIVLREVIPNWPLVIAANRDEHYDRPGEAPQLLCDDPRIFGGRDPRAEGTWLAVSQSAMVCAVANRPRNLAPEGDVCSRGLLCLDAARLKTPIAVADRIGHALAQDNYNGFNLLCATPNRARVFYFDGRLREKTLGRGVFILTTGDVNDTSVGKVRRVGEILDADRPRPLVDWIERLESTCCDHAGDPKSPDALCMHGDKAGTVSSSILAFHERDANLHLFRHCDGHPCESTYKTVPWPDRFFEPAASHE